MQQIFKVIGIMSGTSLDGMDIAYCEFFIKREKWEYKVIHAETIPYTENIKMMLAGCENGTALDLAFTHNKFGNITGQFVKEFIKKYNIQPDFLASHGHTIFHRPTEKMTLQIGCGANIAALTGLPVVCDFRTTDVALGGQGAPLVPIGDKLLFGEYDYCLNLGGFSNVSFEKDGKRIAFDISPLNIVFNHFAKKAGQEFDDGGHIASSGKLCQSLFNELNNLDYYRLSPPKSLGKEWVISKFSPIINSYNLSIADFLNTISEHFALQIGKTLEGSQDQQVLITGGGAFNNHLIERIQNYTSCKLVIPNFMTISFKEAIIFGFLGLLRWLNQNNCLASVTGAEKDSVGGCIYY